MTFTLSTKAAACAHMITSRTQCSSSRFVSRAASLSRHSPSRRWAVRTAEVSPRRRAGGCDLRLAAGGGASAAATARAAADAALPAARLGRGRREGAGRADAPFVFHAADPSSSYSAWLLRAAPRPPRQQQRRRRRRRRSRSRTVGKRGRGRGAAAPRCSPRGRTKGTAVACCCRLAGRLSAAGVLVPPGVARLPRRPLAVAVACAMSVPDGAVAAAADPAAAGLLAPFLFRPRAATAAAGAVPPAGPLRAPLVEASRGPSPSAGTVSGAAAGCPAPLAPGRRPAAAREGWIGRRDGRQSLVRFQASLSTPLLRPKR